MVSILRLTGPLRRHGSAAAVDLRGRGKADPLAAVRVRAGPVRLDAGRYVLGNAV
jgi:hypothetical protein